MPTVNILLSGTRSKRRCTSPICGRLCYFRCHWCRNPLLFRLLCRCFPSRGAGTVAYSTWNGVLFYMYSTVEVAWLAQNIRHGGSGGETFFKVGGTIARQKNYGKFFH